MGESPAWRRRLIARTVAGGFQALATAGGITPWARPKAHGLEREDAVPYGADPAHLVDIYKPPGPGPHPVAIYIHGGGFRTLSRRTHWIMALAFARRGYLTFNIDYRLAPKHPFPAAAEDVCAALRWIWDNASSYGGDLERTVVSGESAGGNLALMAALASATPRPEPWARAVHDAGIRFSAAVPICGILQVSDPRRFSRRKKLPFFLQDVIDETSENYLSGGGGLLADPLVEIEAGPHAPDGWPAFFVPCGTADPLLDDSRRLGTALEALGADVETAWYPGEVHAFHGLIWRQKARACWSDLFAFLDARIPGQAGLSPSDDSDEAGHPAA